MSDLIRLLSLALALPAIYVLGIQILNLTNYRYRLTTICGIVIFENIVSMRLMWQYVDTTPWIAMLGVAILLMAMRTLAIICYWQILYPYTFPRFIFGKRDYRFILMTAVIIVGWLVLGAIAFS